MSDFADWETGPDLFDEPAPVTSMPDESTDDISEPEPSAVDDRVPTYTPNPGLDPVGQAASLALSILAKAGVATWADLNGSIPGDIVVTDAQIALLLDHLEVLQVLQGVSRAHGRQSRTIAYCPDCGQWLVTSRNVGKCVLTFGCKGDLRKVPAANRTKTS